MSQIGADQVTPRTIREIRDTLGLTQEQLANRLGTYQFRVSLWESGKRTPSRLYRALIAATYNGMKNQEQT
jgi:DNA-binding transcriptional regulator YiaG